MRKISKNPVLLVGMLLLAASIVFLLGYMVHLSYFRKAEFGWIIITFLAGLMTIAFGYYGDYQKRKKVHSKVR
ncbi:hypothetical protein ACP0AK_00585 [Listeria ivanovii]|uniref:Uncharacterized protein n=1 Tax=Listeria ivanovii (strain ATCC BAA-678 / PAM 55) TaxID=881621 RepID=G2ZA83_LISIP|nr:hypothetical protein [Listeria ivanovii]AHI56108.1 hypothetical protein AX25_08355 [Listeria ivanovii WSLC3009]AIS65543.1 hypothetical protein JL52_08205 [Listeria ivanovii subsp. ivanovii]MBC1759460.1 hypothetical protein [Listeria ivanovii]MBK3914290.1 hypothetical protein [Listeria ivanovii subsp. ivanovii]MBK3921811.1 hypothetical protein [Listeria ivanovii subsp. ivanovii]